MLSQVANQSRYADFHPRLADEENHTIISREGCDQHSNGVMLWGN